MEKGILSVMSGDINGYSLILASASPRRAALLTQAGYKFKVIVRKTDESLQAGVSPGEAAAGLAARKARAVRDALDGAAYIPEPRVVIGADTVALLDGELLTKPRDAAEAAGMLRRLSGRRHEVLTGVAVMSGSRSDVFCEKTSVSFREILEWELEAYVSGGEPADKAGAYGIQGMGALFADRIEGDYYNVVGLPLSSLGTLLRDAYGISPFKKP